jgi:hypothetical protein
VKNKQKQVSCTSICSAEIINKNQKNGPFLSSCFNLKFWYFLRVSNLKFIFRKSVYVQLWYGAFYMYQYKQYRTQPSRYKTADTAACKTHYTMLPVYTTVFLKMNLQFRNKWKTSKIKNWNINLGNVQFVGLYCIIILQYTVQETKKLTCVNVNIFPTKTTFKQYAQNGGHEI